MGAACSANWEIRNANKLLVGEPEGQRPFEKYRPRWKESIEMNIGDIGLGLWIGFIWTGGGCC